MVVPSAFGCRRTLWPVGPGHCGLDGAPSSMVVKPVTSCRGPTSQRVPLNPGKPELAWWTTSSMAFGRGCGKRSDRVAHYRAPVVVSVLLSRGCRAARTARENRHDPRLAPTCLWHAEVDVHGRSERPVTTVSYWLTRFRLILLFPLFLLRFAKLCIQLFLGPVYSILFAAYPKEYLYNSN
jgi:hypothetical protein